jgi:hypothetical protein
MFISVSRTGLRILLARPAVGAAPSRMKAFSVLPDAERFFVGFVPADASIGV